MSKEEIMKKNAEIRKEIKESLSKVKQNVPLNYLYYAMENKEYQLKKFGSQYEKNVFEILFSDIIDNIPDNEKLGGGAFAPEGRKLDSYSSIYDEVLLDMKNKLNDFFNNKITVKSDSSPLLKYLFPNPRSLTGSYDDFFKIVKNAKGKNLRPHEIKDFLIALTAINNFIPYSMRRKLCTSNETANVLSFLKMSKLCLDEKGNISLLTFAKYLYVHKTVPKKLIDQLTGSTHEFIKFRDFLLLIPTIKIISNNIDDEIDTREKLKNNISKQLSVGEKEFSILKNKLENISKSLETDFISPSQNNKETYLSYLDPIIQRYKDLDTYQYFKVFLRQFGKPRSLMKFHDGTLFTEYQYLQALHMIDDLLSKLNQLGHGFDQAIKDSNTDFNKFLGKDKSFRPWVAGHKLYRGLALKQFLESVINLPNDYKHVDFESLDYRNKDKYDSEKLKTFSAELCKNLNGLTVMDKNFCSTSFDIKATIRYNKMHASSPCVLLTLDISKVRDDEAELSKICSYIDRRPNHASSAGDREVLIKPRVKFKITDCEYKDEESSLGGFGLFKVSAELV